MDESLENIETKPLEVPQALKTLAILSYIGNAFWGIAIFAVLMWALVAPERFEEFITQGSNERLDLDPLGIIVGIVVGLVVCAMPIVGAAMMTKGKKSGYWIYLIPSLLWVILNLSSGQTQNIIISLITVGFIVGFATQLKHLR
jgi:hypothetical protein